MDSNLTDVLTRLKQADPDITEADLTELSDLDQAAARRLEDAWHDCALETRRSVITQLGALAQQHIELTFERVNHIGLEDADAEVRCRAIDNLWESEDPALARSLLTMLRDDPQASVRTQAAQALGRFVYLGEVDKLDASVQEEIEEQLLSALEHEADQAIRQRALESLGYSWRQPIQAHIEQAYTSDEEAWLRSALIAMGRSADERWLSQVIREMDHASPSIRQEAARAAGELEKRQATAKLVELLDDVNSDVRQAAIWSLGQLGGPLARRALLGLLDTQTYEEHTSVIEDALDYLAFLDSTPDLLLFEFDEPEE